MRKGTSSEMYNYGYPLLHIVSKPNTSLTSVSVITYCVMSEVQC